MSKAEEFKSMLFSKAASNVQRVVLPESDDERVLRAAEVLAKSGAVKLVLLGDESAVRGRAAAIGADIAGVEVIDPLTSPLHEDFASTLFELRKAKGMTEQKASELMRDRTFFATMLVYKGLAGAMVSGANTTTATTIRPALQFVKTKPGIATVSGSFIVCLADKIWIMADCAVTPNPTAEQLASIAISTAQTALDFGFDAKVAMLSYATANSADGPDVELVREATARANELLAAQPEAFRAKVAIDGPMQFDAAVDAATASKKLPNSPVAGAANVFVYPNLSCGNICYKAIQRAAGAVAIGPILQGLNKPVNDLSRGCLVEDIVNTVLISAIQAQH